MAVRDLLWACPICNEIGAIRPDAGGEACTACATEFRRGRGARILAIRGDAVQDRTAREWLRSLGPVRVPPAREDGTILGPEAVRVKIARRQTPLRFGKDLLGWVEVYRPALTGTIVLSPDGLLFRPSTGDPVHWAPDDLRAIQPASSSLQVAFDAGVASLRFVETSVRLWSRALGDVVRAHYARLGREVAELQPRIRTRPAGPQ